MINVNITEFRANLLNYLNKAKHGEQISVTSNGQLLATIVAPIDQRKRAKAKLKTIAESAKIHDVISPIDDQWEAMK
jgi:prevent-host-death family protein